MITNLIRSLTSRETSRRNRTSPRRAVKPSLDLLETRLSPGGGGWSQQPVYTPPTPSGPANPPIVKPVTPPISKPVKV